MVPGIFLADGAAASAADHGHSLRSLALPQAALPSLPLPDFAFWAQSLLLEEKVPRRAGADEVYTVL